MLYGPIIPFFLAQVCLAFVICKSLRFLSKTVGMRGRGTDLGDRETWSYRTQKREMRCEPHVGWARGWQPSSVKDRTINIFGFVGLVVSLATAQFCGYHMETCGNTCK